MILVIFVLPQTKKSTHMICKDKLTEIFCQIDDFTLAFEQTINEQMLQQENGKTIRKRAYAPSVLTV